MAQVMAADTSVLLECSILLLSLQIPIDIYISTLEKIFQFADLDFYFCMIMILTLKPTYLK